MMTSEPESPASSTTEVSYIYEMLFYFHKSKSYVYENIFLIKHKSVLAILKPFALQQSLEALK